MAPPTFSTLPTEIRSIIFDFACSEDIFEHKDYGQALNLCLVSKQVHALTLPILYRFLFATGRSVVNSLAQSLREHPERARFTRHVFLSDRPWLSGHTETASGQKHESGAEYELLPDFAFTLPTTQQGRLQRRLRMRNWLMARAEMLTTFENSIQQIVEATSHRLYSLTVLFYSKYHRRPVSDQSDMVHEVLDAHGMDAPTQDCSGKAVADILALEYPRMQELTIREESLSICRPKLRMPALKRLQLAGGEIVLPAATLAAASAGCPNLTQICWTVSAVTVALAEALEWFFGVVTNGDHHSRGALEEFTVSTPAPHALRNLQQFDVQVQRRLGRNSSTSPPTYSSDNNEYLTIALEQRLIALSHVAPKFDFSDASPQTSGCTTYPLETAVSCWRKQVPLQPRRRIAHTPREATNTDRPCGPDNANVSGSLNP